MEFLFHRANMRNWTPEIVYFVIHFWKSNDDYSNQEVRDWLGKNENYTKKCEFFFQNNRTDGVSVAKRYVHRCTSGHRLSTATNTHAHTSTKWFVAMR